APRPVPSPPMSSTSCSTTGRRRSPPSPCASSSEPSLGRPEDTLPRLVYTPAEPTSDSLPLLINRYWALPVGLPVGERGIRLPIVCEVSVGSACCDYLEITGATSRLAKVTLYQRYCVH